MLKVNTNKGKFDIVLNEDNLFKTEAKERVVKGRQSSKGFSGKTSQARTLPPKTSRFKEDGKTKSTSKPQKKDVRDVKLTKSQSTRKDEASTDASYLTKDQLSRILSSLKSVDKHVPAADTYNPSTGSVEIATQQTAVHQRSIKDSEERRAVHTSGNKTKENISENQEQVNISNKNFQWKKELDEQIALKQMLKAKSNLLDNEKELEEYNPWGRPGGGAPVRTQSGNIVTDYKKMHQDFTSKNEVNVVSPPVFGTGSQTKTAVDSYNTHDMVTSTTPVAMRSSFAIGAPGVVKYEAYQSKIDEKKKWLQDLEQQIKEKKERQAQEKQQQLQKEAREERSNQTLVISNESPPAVGHAVVNNTAATTHESPPTAGHAVVNNTAARTHESPVTTGAVSISLDSSFRAGNYHGRGHGLQSLGGEVNQDELERKRLKTLEHQRAIKEQVEEKRRLKQEEKERRLKDEVEKERALMIERDRLQKQYQEELKQRQEKENEAMRRAEALQLSITQAYESAQQEKVAKRIKHLELGGHDVTGLKSPGLGMVQQQAATDTSPRNTGSPRVDYGQSSPRITQHKELPTKTDYMISSSTQQENASFEAELKQISLNASLESEWTTSSPVSSVRNNSQAKSQTKSPSPGKGTGRITARSQSERGQRKKQTLKQRNKRQGSLENVKGEQETAGIPLPLEDAFMIPYTRTTSATFHPVPDTPSSRQADDVSSRKDLTAANRNKQTQKKPQSVVMQQAAYRTTASRAALGRHKTVEKPSVSPRGRQGMGKQDSKTNTVSRKAENLDVKSDQAKIQNENPGLYPVQASPDRLPTARQEMILQQLAALRQGLMMKERELHHSSF